MTPMKPHFAFTLLAGLIAVPQATRAQTAQAGANDPPNISGLWERAWTEAQLFDRPETGPGPVTGDPAWPHIRGANSPWIADLSNPILRPWTSARLKELGDQQKSGHALLDNDSLCLPLGVLASLNIFDSLQILQTPQKVLFLYARDHQVRSVYLKQAHSAAQLHSWYGESIGHYEGNALIVDTVGMNDKTLVDRYGTPHSDQLHTVERYRLLKDGTIEVNVTVEDPIAFTTPWTAKVRYQRAQGAGFQEIVCAENNPSTSNSSLQIPTASKRDF